MKKFFALMMVAVMALSMFAGCANNDDSGSNAIKIGLSGPLTGSAAVYGEAVKVGMEIAVDEINAKGGLQIEFKTEDDASDIEIAGNAYNALKDWGMQIFAGAVTTGPCNTIAPMTAEDKIFMMTPSGSAESIPNAGSNVFQMCFTDPNQGAASAELIKAQMADKTIGIIYDSSTDYSTGIYKSFMAKAEELDLNVAEAAITSFTEDSKSEMTTQLTKCKEAGCDLVFLPIYAAEASTILNNANTMGYAPEFMGCDGMDGILAIDGFDDALAEGLIMMTPFAADADDEKTKAFVAEFEKRTNGVTPNQFAADGYDVIYAIYQACVALEIDGNTDTAEICAKLSDYFVGTSFNGLTGSNMTWDSTGLVNKVPTAVVIKNGVYVSYGN